MWDLEGVLRHDDDTLRFGNYMRLGNVLHTTTLKLGFGRLPRFRVAGMMSCKEVSMKSIRTFTALAVAAAMAAIVLAPSASQAGSVCSWYLKKALQQQQLNVQKKCAMKGDQWDTNPAIHLKWCAGAGPDKSKTMVAERDRALAACKG